MLISLSPVALLKALLPIFSSDTGSKTEVSLDFPIHF